MDRDQDEFFPEDRGDPRADAAPAQPDPQDQSLPYQESDDDHTYLMKLLDYLQDAVSYGGVVPLTGKRLVDSNMCVDIIKDIRGNLPLAIQYADQVMRDRDRILTNAERSATNKLAASEARANSAIDDAEKRAQKIIMDAEDHADKIIKDTEIRARAMVDQSAIKIAAQNEAREIVNEARAEANDRRLSASAYAEELMINVEKELQHMADIMRQKRMSLSGGDNRPIGPAPGR